MDVLWVDFVKEFLTDAAKTDLSQKIFVFFIAWYVVKRSVREHMGRIEAGLAGHFERIEDGLGNVAKSVQELNQAMLKLETSHSQRITNLENEFQNLNSKVLGLEKSKGE